MDSMDMPVFNTVSWLYARAIETRAMACGLAPYEQPWIGKARRQSRRGDRGGARAGLAWDSVAEQRLLVGLELHVNVDA